MRGGNGAISVQQQWPPTRQLADSWEIGQATTQQAQATQVRGQAGPPLINSCQAHSGAAPQFQGSQRRSKGQGSGQAAQGRLSQGQRLKTCRQAKERWCVVWC